jgi:PAS domain S-box-containing protein
MQLSEGLSSELSEHVPDAILVVDCTGCMVNRNEQVEILFYNLRNEFIGQDFEVLLPELFRECHVHDRKNYFTSPRRRRIGNGLNLFGKRGDGSEFPVDVSLVHLNKNNKELVIALIRDIADYHQPQEKMGALAAKAVIGIDGVQVLESL